MQKYVDFMHKGAYNMHILKKRGALFMNKDSIKKVVLAYSGGLDTSIIIPWLKENYNNCEVIAVSGDVGQGTELDGLEEKALKTGASKLYVLDLTDEYVDNYIVPCLKAIIPCKWRYLSPELVCSIGPFQSYNRDKFQI